MDTRAWAIGIAAVIASASGLGAQTAWESPRLLSPSAPPLGTGLYGVRFSALPGDGGGGFVTLAPFDLPPGASIRLGATKGAAGVTTAFGGIDVSLPILRRDAGAPLDIAWNTGVGASVGGYLVGALPVGIAAGRGWELGSTWVAPYLGARGVLEVRLGNAAPRRVIDVSPGLDVGLDLALGRSRKIMARAATSLGDRSALALGLGFRR